MELTPVWLVSNCLIMIWEERQAGRVAHLVHCPAELQAMLLLLKAALNLNAAYCA